VSSVRSYSLVMEVSPSLLKDKDIMKLCTAHSAMVRVMLSVENGSGEGCPPRSKRGIEPALYKG
jgi:hypothetical protein